MGHGQVAESRRRRQGESWPLPTMFRMQSGLALVDGAQYAFLRSPVAVDVASRTADLTPSIEDASGCRVGVCALGYSLDFVRDLFAEVEQGARGGSASARCLSRCPVHVRASA